MKLENLLALYLYQNKQLRLPGIGVFTADNVIAVPEDNDKHPVPVQGISFTNTNVVQPDDEFIDFIKTHTGKMKPLAISDLESYLMLSKQFLNIGKPFHIDGVGTLQKVNDGSLKFTPGEYVSTKLELPGEKNIAESRKRTGFGEEIREYNKSSNGSKKAVFLLAAIATILLAGWGGYYLFKQNTTPEHLDNTVVPADTITENTIPQDTLQNTLSDSTAHALKRDSIMATPPGSYKYVVETTTSKARALKRFSDLKSFKQNYQMETKDSLLYKIYVIKSSPAADTTRLKDSLNAWYYGTRDMKVKIEQ